MVDYLDEYYAEHENECISCFDCSLRNICHESRNIAADYSCIEGTINTLLLKYYSKMLPDSLLTKDSNIYNKFVFNNKLETVSKLILVDTYDEASFRSFIINYKDIVIYKNGYPKSNLIKSELDSFHQVLFTNSYMLGKLWDEDLLKHFDYMIKDTLRVSPLLFIDHIFHRFRNNYKDLDFIIEKLSFDQKLVIIDFYRNKYYYKELLKDFSDIQVVIWDIKK